MLLLSAWKPCQVLMCMSWARLKGCRFFVCLLVSRDAPVVYINGGTHGDEPAGVEAALAFLEGGWERWADRVRFEVIPCLCPWSYVHNARLNAQDVDVNWAYLRDDVPEIEILKGFLEGQVFAGVIDLHEDWESPGFYLYEMFGDPRSPWTGDGDAGGTGLSD